MRLKLLAVGLLAMVLAGCTTMKVPETIVLTPPASLLKDCQYVQGALKTNRDLLMAYKGAMEALELCNNDKAALREWVREVHEGRTQK